MADKKLYKCPGLTCTLTSTECDAKAEASRKGETMDKEDLNYKKWQSDTDKLLDAAHRAEKSPVNPINSIGSLYTNLPREPGYTAREQLLEAKELIYRMRQVIWSVIQWNDEYRHLNNLSGDPSWVQTAYDVFMDSRPK